MRMKFSLKIITFQESRRLLWSYSYRQAVRDCSV
jgi:hypothetical protein